MKNTLLIAFVVLSCIFGSCKKDKDVTPETKTDLLTRAPWVILKEELLINGNWKTEVLTLDGQTVTFRNDGTCKVEENGQPSYQPWKFVENETKILMQDANPPLRTITILTLDELQLTSLPIMQGEPEERYTFVHP